MWCWLWVLYTFSLTAGSPCSLKMTSWVSGCPLWLRFPGGWGEPERRPGEQIHAANRHSFSLLSFFCCSDAHIHSRLTFLPPPSELRVCYWLSYDVLTDEADVCSPLGDSLSVLFSKLKSSGISWVMTIIWLCGDLVRRFLCLRIAWCQLRHTVMSMIFVCMRFILVYAVCAGRLIFISLCFQERGLTVPSGRQMTCCILLLLHVRFAWFCECSDQSHIKSCSFSLF